MALRRIRPRRARRPASILPLFSSTRTFGTGEGPDPSTSAGGDPFRGVSMDEARRLTGIPGRFNPNTGGFDSPGDEDIGGPNWPSRDFAGLYAALAGLRGGAESQARAMAAAREAAIRAAYAATLPQIGQNYGRAIQESQSVNDAVANRLAAEGSGTNAQLTAKLAQIGASGNTEIPASLLAYYKGLGGANYAEDEGDVQRLIGRQTEEQNLVPKLQQGDINRAEAELAQQLFDIGSSFDEKQLSLKEEESTFKYEDEWRRKQWLQDQQDKLQASYEREQDRIASERAAAMATANSNRQKALDRQFKAQQAAAERNFKIAMANAKYQASAKTAADKQAWEAEKMAAQHGYDVALKKTPPGKAPGSKGSGGDTVETPGSAKRARAYKAAWSSVVRPDGQVRYLARYGDASVNNAINAALRGQGVDPNSPTGKQIRNSIKQQIKGRAVFRPPNRGDVSRTQYSPGMKGKPKKKKPKK